jgi:RIO kinase 1
VSFRGYDDWNDFAQDLEELPDSQAISRLRRTTKPKLAAAEKKKSVAPPPAALTNEGDEFQFTYQASRYEAEWLMQSLMEFYDQQWFDDVLRLVKGGKEASVYQCLGNETTGQGYIAAKIYRPRKFRNLKNDHIYREGRADLDTDGNIILDDGMLHAMRKKTGYGKELLHTSWIEHEVKTMQVLRAAGADVPDVFASHSNAILMSYIGDDELGAPALQEIDLDAGEAKALFERILWNIELMLANNRVHGDLSAYNILYMDGQITLIDFPQAITPEQNANAFAIFKRDVVRVCEYFQRYRIHSNPHALAKDLWTGHHHRTAPEIDPHFLDDQSSEDRELWRKQTGR